MAAGIGAGAPLSVQTEERRRWAARQRHWHLLHSDILQHSERVAPLDATRLTSEQEAALAACFAALEAEPPVGRYARAIGKISLDELSLCLKALGYRAEQELACLQEAAALAAADDPCRLSADMFMRLFGRAPKPPAVLKNLTSIGKVAAAVRREAVEQAADRAAGPSVASSEEGRFAAEARMKKLADMGKEAFPFSIVADAHRISTLISAYTSGGAAAAGPK